MERERSVPSRPYKLSHQLLCIKSINFQKQSLIGLVEINLIPQRNNIEKIKFSCKQCKIFRLTLNDVYDVPFKYNDPTLDICHDEGKAKQKSVDIFSAAHHSAVVSVDADYSKGEITVTIPKHLQHHVVEGRPIKITLEFGIERPLGGLHFVVPADGNVPLSYAERGAHVYSYGFENCSRLWFPCVDVFSEPCTWKMEFTVDATMVAVAPGDLLEVVFNESMKKKTYHYQLNTPTSASCIGVAIGPFEIMVDPNMHEVTHFCLPHLMPLLKDTTGFLHETFEFYEELLSTRYPYTCYKQVFVDEAYSPSQSYATMTVFDINLLHSKHIVDQTYHTRRILSAALAQQFFGCFMTMNSYADAWLTRGISGYLGLQYHKKAFGNNEYRVFVYKQLDEVIEYEQKYGGIVLDPTTQKPSENTFYFSNRTLHTLSPVYEEALTKKAIIVMRMLEDRIGKELFFQVFNKLLTLGGHCIAAKTDF
ncbi:Transcription initiation factor TFIID subunit 2 [Halotydeus destructor]|nr:Transcription initiation factor TFIID subunit 2 [Halotydeus destructor]